MEKKARDSNQSNTALRSAHWLAFVTRLTSVPRVIWWSSASALFGFMSFFLLLAALPVYFSHLGYQPAQIGLIIGAAYAINFLAYFFTAIVSDRWGSRMYIIISGLLLAVAPLIFELSHTFTLFIVASIWQGMTMSAFTTAITAYVGQHAPADRRGTIMGFFGIFPNLAQAAAPPLGILIGVQLGFPLLFDFSTASAIIAALLVFTLPRNHIAATHFNLRIWLRGTQRLAQPGLVQFALGACRGVTIAFLPIYMLRGGVSNPGLFFTCQIFAIILLRPVSGVLSDRYGRLAVIVPSLLCAAVGIGILAFPASYVTLLLSGIVFGIAVSMLVPAVLAWIFDVTSAEQRGLASGIYNTVYDLGRAGSAFGFGVVIAVSGYSTMFLFVGLIPLIVIAILLVWQRLSGRQKGTALIPTMTQDNAEPLREHRDITKQTTR